MVVIAGVGVGRRVHTAYARSRLMQACYEAALDTVHPAALELASAEERAWLREALERPTSAAAEAALDVLAARLEEGARGRTAGTARSNGAGAALAAAGLGVGGATAYPKHRHRDRWPGPSCRVTRPRRHGIR